MLAEELPTAILHRDAGRLIPVVVVLEGVQGLSFLRLDCYPKNLIEYNMEGIMPDLTTM